MDILESVGERIPATVRQSDRLTQYATATRYPGVEEPVGEQDYAEAVQLAEAVVHWAERTI